jgi:hypothetical protein
MTSRLLTPTAWRSLSRADRLEMLAYQTHLNERREKIINDVVDKLPNEFGMLAQALINALG